MGLRKFSDLLNKNKGKVAATLVAPAVLSGMIGLSSKVEFSSMEEATDYIKNAEIQNSETIKEIESELETIEELTETSTMVIDSSKLQDDNDEIEKRIESLNELANKLSAMLDKVEQSKSGVSPELQAEIDKLHEELNEIGLVNNENAKQIEEVYKQLVELGKSVSEISAKQEIKYDIEASRALNTLGCKLAKIELDLEKHIRTGGELNHEDIAETLTNLESSLNDLASNGQIPENVYKELEQRIVNTFDLVCLCNLCETQNKSETAVLNGAMSCWWTTTESADGSNRAVTVVDYTYGDGNLYNKLRVTYNSDESKTVTKSTYEKQSTKAENGKYIVYANIKNESLSVDKNGKCSNYKMLKADSSCIYMPEDRLQLDEYMEELEASNLIFDYNKENNLWSGKMATGGMNQKIVYSVDASTGKFLQCKLYDENKGQVLYFSEVPEMFADILRREFDNLDNIAMFNIEPMVDEPQQNQ